MRVVVHGLGKIGLPLAVYYAAHGFHVTGVDVPARIGAIERFENLLPWEPGLHDLTRAQLRSGTLQTSPTAPVSDLVADFHILTVPVRFENGHVEYTRVDEVVRSISRTVTAHSSTVIVETTMPVGATRQRVSRAIERLTGCREGIDFFVAYSPERVSSGSIHADLGQYPKLLGGVSTMGSAKAEEFYANAISFTPRPDLSKPNGVWVLSNSEAAELAKLAEACYRDVNIALANVVADAASRLELNVLDVIAACNSQPFSALHTPSVTVGGHCIPVYPELFMASLGTVPLLREARHLNGDRGHDLIAQLGSEIGGLRDRHVVLVGASYRPGIAILDGSGIFELVRTLNRAGAYPSVTDTSVSDLSLSLAGLPVHTSGDSVDAILLHNSGLPDDWQVRFPGAQFYVDFAGVHRI